MAPGLKYCVPQAGSIWYELLKVITAASLLPSNSCTKGTRKRILRVVNCVLNKCTSYLLAFIHTFDDV